MYLSGEGISFSFKHEKINKINENDVLIADGIYNEFFKNQSEGKQFIVKNKNGITFEEIFEEISQQVIFNFQ